MDTAAIINEAIAKLRKKQVALEHCFNEQLYSQNEYNYWGKLISDEIGTCLWRLTKLDKLALLS